jgi:arylsulfatase A-like enzyme
MISYLDEQIGEIVAKLKELGLYENSVIMFSSDNGPITSFYGGVDFFDSGGPLNIENRRGNEGATKGTAKTLTADGGCSASGISSRHHSG